MSSYSFIITPFTILLSLTTAAGVFVHDSKLDAAALTAVAAPVVLAGGVQKALAKAEHTHSDRGSLTQAVSDAKGKNPLLQPRSAHKNKKYITKRKMIVGHRTLFGSIIPLA